MIELKNIYKTYNLGGNNEYCALKDISVKFPDKGLFIIRGKSGSGKSTLLNIISGIDSPTKGEVITNYNTNNYTSFIFQEFFLIDYLSVKDNIKLLNSDDELYKSLIDKYGLTSIENHRPNEISGGEKQRVAIIRAIMDNKPVILCDEPTGNLDLENSRKIEEILKEISKEKLVIVVTHENSLFNEADGVITISDGCIINNTLSFSNTKEKIEVKENKLNFKTSLLLNKNFIKNNKAKHVFAFISFILSLLMLISSLNILFNGEGSVIYNTYKDTSMPIDLSKTTSYGHTTIFDKQLEKYKNKYDADIFYEFEDDKYDTYNELKFKRFYIANTFKGDLIYGSNNLLENQIIISDYNALNINNDLSKVVGQMVGIYRIVGIFKTNYQNDKFLNDLDNLKYKRYYAVYLNEESYNNYINEYIKDSSSIYLNLIKNEEDFLNTQIYYDVMLNKNEKLNDGEIIISTTLFNYLSDGINATEDYIGKTITFSFFNLGESTYYKVVKNYDYECREYTFKIVGFDNSRDCYVSENQYYEISSLFSVHFNRDMMSGISCYNKSKITIKRIIGDGFSDNGIYQDQIQSGIDWLKPLSYILLGVGILVILITTIIYINFLHSIFDREKKTIGILASFGVKKRGLVRLYFIDALELTLLSLIFSFILEIPVIYLLNKMLYKFGISNIKCIYYEFLPMFILFLFVILINLIVYTLMLKKMNKKNTIDLIYNR